jgi:hypothetical protein
MERHFMKTTPSRSRTILSNDEILRQIRSLLESPEDDLSAGLLKELMAGIIKLHEAHLEPLDLKIVNRAIKELRHAFRVFRDYHHRKKVSIFGSARTTADDPNYRLLPPRCRSRFHGHHRRSRRHHAGGAGRSRT